VRGRSLSRMRSRTKIFSEHMRTFASKVFDNEEADIKRKELLDAIYGKPLSGLTRTQKQDRLLQGDIWWNHATLEKRPSQPFSPDLEKLLARVEEKRERVKDHNPLLDKDSPVWRAFQIALSHHSTALEGNRLTKGESEAVIDEYAAGISTGLGLPLSAVPAGDMVKIKGKNLPTKDVLEVANHASALEFLRRELLHKAFTTSTVVQLNSIIYPEQHGLFYVTVEGLGPTLFRKLPIKVRGCPALSI